MAAAVSAVAKESTAARAGELWAASGLAWPQFLEDGADADKFVKDKVSFEKTRTGLKIGTAVMTG